MINISLYLRYFAMSTHSTYQILQNKSDTVRQDDYRWKRIGTVGRIGKGRYPQSVLTVKGPSMA